MPYNYLFLLDDLEIPAKLIPIFTFPFSGNVKNDSVWHDSARLSMFFFCYTAPSFKLGPQLFVTVLLETIWIFVLSSFIHILENINSQNIFDGSLQGVKLYWKYWEGFRKLYCVPATKVKRTLFRERWDYISEKIN